MDALKKAEREKKEAAKRLKESEANEPSVRLADTHEPDPTQPGEHKQASPAIPRLEKTITGENPSAVELSLAPMDQQQHQPEEVRAFDEAEQPPTEAQDKPSDLSLEMVIAAAEADAQNEETEESSRDVEELDGDTRTADLLDRTFPGVDIKDKKVKRGKLDDTVEDEFEAEPPFHEETLPGVPAVQLAEDLGGEDQPTPVAAQTIFAATDKTKRATSGFRWLLIGCCVIAVLAGLVWYYFTVTPMNVSMPSPIVAKGVESIVPAQPINPPAGVVSGALMEAPQTAANKVEGPTPPPAEPAAKEVESEIPLPPAAGAEATITVQPQVESVPSGPGPVATASEPEAAVTGPAREAQAQELPETIELSPSLIKISRSKGIDKQGRLVNEAYAAYQAQDFATAGEKYEQVLAEQPDNRDALLGIGAVAGRNGEGLKALQAYTRLLKLNPRDELARALLIGLQSNAEISRSESAIKVMIQENPDLPVLYFTLGNIYAEQSRWAEAQQAFFDAYRQDSSNPDYALNLAISLDKLGQSATALDYYNTALKLADQKTASFDPARVVSRIETLSSLKKP